VPQTTLSHPSVALTATATHSAHAGTDSASAPEVIPFPVVPTTPVGPTTPPAAALATTRRSERGQTTAEYALVLVGAATIAMLIVAWAGSTSRISGLFDTVIRSVTTLLA
jgi:hypothetical protein